MFVAHGLKEDDIVYDLDLIVPNLAASLTLIVKVKMRAKIQTLVQSDEIIDEIAVKIGFRSKKQILHCNAAASRRVDC